jgi:hypothetical protein
MVDLLARLEDEASGKLDERERSGGPEIAV